MAASLSIVVPVYNVEKTLGESLRSIQCARPEEIELIFVNDGSTDCTQDILESYQRQSVFPCKIIRQKNAGAAAARNAALDLATGIYLAFLDADDWWEEGALDRILALTQKDADIIGWDFKSVNKRGERTIRQSAYCTPEEALRNLMGGTMKWNLWLFAVKHKLVTDNSIRFLSGFDMGEDMGFMLRVFACAGQVEQIRDILYCYNASNPTSISRQLNPKRRAEVTYNLQEAEKFLMASSYKDLCKAYLPHLKLYIKRPLLISFSKEDYKQWYDWFSEANPFALKNKALPLWTRSLQWLASKRMWNSVNLFNFLYDRILRWKS